jgi:hypothetical protein
MITGYSVTPAPHRSDKWVLAWQYSPSAMRRLFFGASDFWVVEKDLVADILVTRYFDSEQQADQYARDRTSTERVA